MRAIFSLLWSVIPLLQYEVYDTVDGRRRAALCDAGPTWRHGIPGPRHTHPQTRSQSYIYLL